MLTAAAPLRFAPLKLGVRRSASMITYSNVAQATYGLLGESVQNRGK